MTEESSKFPHKILIMSYQFIFLVQLQFFSAWQSDNAESHLFLMIKEGSESLYVPLATGTVSVGYKI